MKRWCISGHARHKRSLQLMRCAEVSQAISQTISYGVDRELKERNHLLIRTAK